MISFSSSAPCQIHEKSAQDWLSANQHNSRLRTDQNISIRSTHARPLISLRESLRSLVIPSQDNKRIEIIDRLGLKPVSATINRMLLVIDIAEPQKDQRCDSFGFETVHECHGSGFICWHSRLACSHSAAGLGIPDSGSKSVTFLVDERRLKSPIFDRNLQVAC